MRCRVGFSSRKAIMIATSVISGVVPLMIPASALVTYCWPKLKSIHGTEAQSMEAMNTYFHDHRGKIGVRVIALMMIKAMAPKAMRVNATPAGVKD